MGIEAMAMAGKGISTCQYPVVAMVPTSAGMIRGFFARISGGSRSCRAVRRRDLSRREWLSDGKIPLQTIRADVDYATATAFTTYGTVGIKVWIYRGEIFEKTAESGKDEKAIKKEN